MLVKTETNLHDILVNGRCITSYCNSWLQRLEQLQRLKFLREDLLWLNVWSQCTTQSFELQCLPARVISVFLLNLLILLFAY